MRRLLIMGPPGAGKGTQAVGIAAQLQVPAISTGDMFRALQHASSPLAEKVRAIMAAGGYVDDETTNVIVDDRLDAADCDGGFLLDGYPRTLTQVHHLDELLRQQGARLDAVVCLDVDEDEVLRRLLARGRDQTREDDQAETIRDRLALYREQTAPLIEQYRHRGLLRNVSATGSLNEIAERIIRALRDGTTKGTV